MTKFSVGGDDGEGPSNPSPAKRQRASFSYEPISPVSLAVQEDDDFLGEGEGEEDGRMRSEDSEPDSEAGSESEEERIHDQENSNNHVSSTGHWMHGRDNSSSDDVPLTSRRDLTQRESAMDDSSFATSVVPTLSNSPVPMRSSRSGSIYVTLTDPEVLDCPICYEPFTIPVFQCENGHTACSSCCKKVAHKCPSCSLPTGYNRCRAIEKVLESVKISCQNMKYGCKETISYSKRCEHDRTCIYSPCSCPLSTCNFISSCIQLYQHFSSKHSGSVLHFGYSKTFPIFFTVNERFLVLQEEKERVLFILNNRVDFLGNVITIGCIGPPSSKEGYFYELTARTEGSNLRFQSFTKNVQGRIDHPPSVGFLFVPNDFFGSYGQISMDLCIWRRGACPANILRRTGAL